MSKQSPSLQNIGATNLKNKNKTDKQNKPITYRILKEGKHKLVQKSKEITFYSKQKMNDLRKNDFV